MDVLCVSISVKIKRHEYELLIEEKRSQAHVYETSKIAEIESAILEEIF